MTIQNPQLRCNAVIWLDSEHRSNTYCMLDQGHDGKHLTLVHDVKDEENPMCECLHLKSFHGKHGCEAYNTLGCKCVKSYDVTVTKTLYKERVDGQNN